MAHSPSYYTRGSIEVWDFIRDQGLNYHLGNAVKYICRAGYKDDKIEDLEKAVHYLNNELQFITRGGVPLPVQPPTHSFTPDYTEDFDR